MHQCRTNGFGTMRTFVEAVKVRKVPGLDFRWRAGYCTFRPLVDRPLM